MKQFKDILPDMYQLENAAPAGKGSSAEVWKVRHKAWNRFLAVKVLSDSSAAENIRNECNRWIQLGLHPNIVSCYYVKEIESIPCIFCEWCGGGSLHEHIAQASAVLYPKDGDAQSGTLLRIAIQIMLALQYTHSVGKFYHGDVKPQNILLTKDGRAKLTDFGCAGIKDISGTREYFSPEQLALYEQDDSVLLTSATDVYSWAVTVLEMFLGRKLWNCGTQVPKIFKEMEHIEMPGTLRTLLEECLAAHPGERPDDNQILHSLGEIYAEVCGSQLYSDTEKLMKSANYYETAEFCNNRALSSIDMKQYNEAERYFRKAEKIAPHHPAVTYNKAVWDWVCGKNEFSAVTAAVDSMKPSPVKDFAVQQCETVKDFRLVKKLSVSPCAEDIQAIQFSSDSKAVRLVYADGTHCCLKIADGSEVSSAHYQWDEMHEDAVDRLGRHICHDNSHRFYDSDSGRRYIEFEYLMLSMVYTFNQNGSLFAAVYSDDEQGKLKIITIDGEERLEREIIRKERIEISEFDLGGELGFWLCEIETFEEMAAKYQKFNDLMIRLMEYRDISESIALVNELEPLRQIGGDCLEQYFQAKELLYRRCIRENMRIGPECFYQYTSCIIDYAVMTEDGAYILFLDNKLNVRLTDIRSGETVWLDSGIGPFHSVHSLRLTKDGQIQLVYVSMDVDDLKILCSPDSCNSADTPPDVRAEMLHSWSENCAETYLSQYDYRNFTKENFKDIDEFISRNQSNLLPEPRMPWVIRQACKEKHYTHFQVNSDYTRLLAVSPEGEIFVYYLDYDLRV